MSVDESRDFFLIPSMFISFTDAAAIIVALTCARLLRAWSKRYRGVKLPYPPGPKGLWYFGFSKFPTKKPWLTYVEWGKQYGVFQQ